VCGEWPYRGRAAERGNELPSTDVDCHSPRPDLHHACCNVGDGSTPQSAGLRLASHRSDGERAHCFSAMQEVGSGPSRRVPLKRTSVAFRT
jgi:hypothetical protein